MKKLLSFIVFIAVVVVGFIFANLNASVVALNYYVGTLKVSLALLLALTLLCGALMMLLVLSYPLTIMRLKVLRLKSQLAKAKERLPS